MTPSEEIRLRFSKNEPLNLSIVAIEAPHLLEGLWEPGSFIGWRRTLEAAGLSVDAIRILPCPVAFCPLCDWHAGPKLTAHLAEVHNTNIATVRRTHPESDDWCEEWRSRRMGSRHHGNSLTLAPHWEPAWSTRYALDRLRWLYDQRFPVNYVHIAVKEPGLAAYLRRTCGSWDKVLQRIGLDPKAIRLAAPSRDFSEAQVLRKLKLAHRKNPSRLHLNAHSSSTTLRPLLRPCCVHFKSYEAALRAAGIDPLPLIPALADPVLLAQRDLLLTEAEARRSRRLVYDAAETAAFLARHTPALSAFYGTWAAFTAALGCLERDIFQPPPFTAYQTETSIIPAIQERRDAGLSVRESEARVDNGPLVIQGRKHFGTWAAALKAAAVQRPPRMLKMRHYTPESVLTFLRDRHAAGLPMSSAAIFDDPKIRIIIKWIRRYYGGYHAALNAAGLPLPIRRKAKTVPGPKRFQSPDQVIADLQARAAKGLPLKAAGLYQPQAEGGDFTLLHASRRVFGSFSKALAAAGLTAASTAALGPRDISREVILQTLIQRQRDGLPLHRDSFAKGTPADRQFLRALHREFGCVANAAAAANLPPPVRLRASPYADSTPAEILAELQRRQQSGQWMDTTSIMKSPQGHALYNAVRAHFPSWKAALTAAGLDPTIRKPHHWDRDHPQAPTPPLP
jgi:hypothetical protein